MIMVRSAPQLANIRRAIILFIVCLTVLLEKKIFNKGDLS